MDSQGVAGVQNLYVMVHFYCPLASIGMNELDSLGFESKLANGVAKHYENTPM